MRILLLAVALLACEPARPQTPRAVPTYDVRDDTGAFLAFWERAQNDAPDARVARFEREVVPTFPQYFEYLETTARRRDRTLADVIAPSLEKFPKIEVKYRALHLRSAIDDSITSFRRTFPDFAPTVHVRILHSLDQMDGGTRVLRGELYLLFGVDVIARVHDFDDQRPFFAHELLHVYYAQKHGKDGRNPKLVESAIEETVESSEPLYLGLWDEGLAVYVSKALNPSATNAEMLLAVPEGLVPNCELRRTALASELRTQLDSRDPDVYRRYFTVRGGDAEHPSRSAYYFGYLAAQRLAKRHSLPELVMLEGAPLRQELDDALADIAKP